MEVIVLRKPKIIKVLIKRNEFKKYKNSNKKQIIRENKIKNRNI